MALKPFNQLSGSPLDSFQQVNVFLVLGTPEWVPALWMDSLQSRVEGESLHAGQADWDPAQDVVAFLGCEIARSCLILNF